MVAYSRIAILNQATRPSDGMVELHASKSLSHCDAGDYWWMSQTWCHACRCRFQVLLEYRPVPTYDCMEVRVVWKSSY